MNVKQAIILRGYFHSIHHLQRKNAAFAEKANTEYCEVKKANSARPYGRKFFDEKSGPSLLIG